MNRYFAFQRDWQFNSIHIGILRRLFKSSLVLSLVHFKLSLLHQTPERNISKVFFNCIIKPMFEIAYLDQKTKVGIARPDISFLLHCGQCFLGCHSLFKDEVCCHGACRTGKSCKTVDKQLDIILEKKTSWGVI